MSTDAERNAVEKMKLAAMQGIPGEPVGEPEAPPAEPIDLPPHQRILTLTMDSTPVERETKKKIPAAQLARIIFKLSTGDDEDDSTLKVGEARILLHQLTHLNQVIEESQLTARLAEAVLTDVLKGGAEQRKVVEVISLLKKARQ